MFGWLEDNLFDMHFSSYTVLGIVHYLGSFGMNTIYDGMGPNSITLLLFKALWASVTCIIEIY